VCGNETICQAPCTSNSECSEVQECGSDGHCTIRLCTAGGTCPAPLGCQRGACGQVACVQDVECGTGACVGGYCDVGPGICVTP
jgi:hypothetical protein